MEKRGMALLVLTALALILLTLQTQAQDLPTELEVQYNNTPPLLIQDIPDQYLAIDIPKINAFDLDDYFVDNETLSYSVNYSGGQNVTVTIDSENIVSFTPETGFNGTINVTFLAYDGFVTTESNIVQIFVEEDKEPPQWSNPNIFHQGTLIYQNSYVNFTVDWTDNYALKDFIFMINQGSGYTSYAAESMTGAQNTSRASVQISSDGGTVYWKIGAYDLSGNYNETVEQNFTVQQTPSPPSGDDDEDDDDGEPRYREGGGYAPAPTQPGEEIEDFTVSPSSFSVELKQGSSITVTFKVTNTGTSTLPFRTRIIGLTALNTTLSRKEFNISAGESKTVSLIIESEESTPVDIYFGSIAVESGENTIEIPTSVTVKASVTDIELDLAVLEEYKEVKPEETVKANISLKNLGELETKKIELYYSLKDFKGNILTSNTSSVELSQKSTSFEKELIVPENAPTGEYIFFARATLKGDTDINSDTFFVGSRFTVWGFIRTNLLIVLIITASIIVALLMVKHYRNQERLRLLNLYIMITNLKKLLKENKIDDAIKLYVRIKSSYGQPVSRTALKNREEVKKQMEKLTDKLHGMEAIKKEAEKQQKKEDKEDNEKGEEKEEGEENKERAEKKSGEGKGGKETKEETKEEKSKEAEKETEEKSKEESHPAEQKEKPEETSEKKSKPEKKAEKKETAKTESDEKEEQEDEKKE